MQLPNEDGAVTLNFAGEQAACGDVDGVLLAALEQITRTPWRAVCPGVAVERIEPYRTLVLAPATLGALRGWQQGDQSCATPFQVEIVLHAPLAN